jgi:enediyne biosynthesis protein E4
VRIVAAGATYVQEVRGGGSYYSQNDLRVHFGLGRAAAIERIEVRWPNGLEEQWAGVAVDRILSLKEGTGTAVAPGR